MEDRRAIQLAPDEVKSLQTAVGMILSATKKDLMRLETLAKKVHMLEKIMKDAGDQNGAMTLTSQETEVLLESFNPLPYGQVRGLAEKIRG